MQPAQLDQLLHPQFDPKAAYAVLAKGLNASPGAAVGKVYFTADDAEARARGGGAGHPRAPRDVARRPARHDRGRGHPHVTRRSREPRRGGRARHGQARDLRRRRAEDRPAGQAVRGRRHRRARRRRDLDLGHDRRDRASARCRWSRPNRRVTSRSSSVGPTSCARSRCAPTPTFPRTRPRRASSVPKASACAAPSTCSSATACRSCSA